MGRNKERKKQLDRQRTEWRKKHRTLSGRIILYPEKPPEHINARGSKIYNWFWKKILLESDQNHIPAIISLVKNQLKHEKNPKSIQRFRTMISMAEDAYQLKNLQDIKDADPELQLGGKPIYDSEAGLIYRNGTIYTTDYNADESSILVRDTEGTIIDRLSSEELDGQTKQQIIRNNTYKNWNYTD